MKRAIKYLGLAVVLLLLVLFAVFHYHTTAKEMPADQQALIEAQTVVTQANAKLVEQRGQITQLRVDYNKLHDECLKGVTAYDKLTAQVKPTVAAPACGDPLEE